jgi:hypothetical protein
MILALSAGEICWTERRRGRVAEGTSLLRMHTAYTCIVSSNLTVSARKKQKAPARELFSLTHNRRRVGHLHGPRVRFEGLGVLRPALSESPICCAPRAQRRAPRARDPCTPRTSSRKARRPMQHRTKKLAQRAAPAHSTKIPSGTSPHNTVHYTPSAPTQSRPANKSNVAVDFPIHSITTRYSSDPSPVNDQSALTRAKSTHMDCG